MTDDQKLVYLMRGLPACGKSHRARRLAGPKGIVLETDEYFYTQVGEDPGSYDYSDELLPTAREWNLARFREAVARGMSPIVVDRGNGLNRESRNYAIHAVQQGYDVQLVEPDSDWWQEVRILLKYREYLDQQVLDTWAQRLAEATRHTHRVPAATIRRWMSRWRHDLTIEDILRYEAPPESE